MSGNFNFVSRVCNWVAPEIARFALLRVMFGPNHFLFGFAKLLLQIVGLMASKFIYDKYLILAKK